MRQLPSYNLEKLKILVVDDNKNMRRIVRQVLHSLGIKEVREADDGADAFKTLKTFAADIIIADWLMSPFDGLEFTHMVRTDKATWCAPTRILPTLKCRSLCSPGIPKSDGLPKPATPA